MNDITLILASLKSRWLNATLSVFLTMFGVMLAMLIIQFGAHIQNRLGADGQGIDIVVGAKGSPLQLILSTVYHIDIPTGNIPYDAALKWMKHPHIKTSIPLALGDNWRGYRIVGTTPAYMKHYGAELNDGQIWNNAFQAVAGASVGLNIGDQFAGAHGLSYGGHRHEKQNYSVVGIMKPTGTILDRLILTSLDSVLKIHGHEGIDHNNNDHHDHSHHDHDHDHDDPHPERDSPPEITALLLTTKTPIANINLPRSINRETTLQAANPALEMARLSGMLGLGTQSFSALSALLIVIAALSIFSGLAGSLENRMGDLAILRAIGYSRHRILKIIALEGMIIVTLGLILGLAMGLYGFTLLIELIPPLKASGAGIAFTNDIVLIICTVLLAGFVAAILPALRGARVDVARQIARST